MKSKISHQLKLAKDASHALAYLSSSQKNTALYEMIRSLKKGKSEILKANQLDILKTQKMGKNESFFLRLKLTDAKINEMIKGIEQIINIEDPIGKIDNGWTRPNGLQISKIRVPLGVIAVVFESRPNVVSDVCALALKSGNAIILKGGIEATHTNAVITHFLKKGLENSKISQEIIQFLEIPKHEDIKILLKLSEYIDVVIPRGGKALIKMVVENSKIPVIFQNQGICHAFIDETADLEMAMRIVINAKTSNPSVCNAIECLLVHQTIAEQFLRKIGPQLLMNRVEIRGDRETLKWIPEAKAVCPEDYGYEFLDLILAVRVVQSIEEALDHISKFGSQHSEVIVTNSLENERKFLSEVDAACVYSNASTRFTDGGEFGFGAEIGISTQKLHARGPVGLQELTTYKYIIRGSGQIRE
jgi:glutamate-5-semialdehyde dehydrogenase